MSHSVVSKLSLCISSLLQHITVSVACAHARTHTHTHTHTHTATLDGGIGYILPVPEKTYRRLLMLQSKLVQGLSHIAGLNPKAFRYCILLGNSQGLPHYSKLHPLTGCSPPTISTFTPLNVTYLMASYYGDIPS